MHNIGASIRLVGRKIQIFGQKKFVKEFRFVRFVFQKLKKRLNQDFFLHIGIVLYNILDF